MLCLRIYSNLVSWFQRETFYCRLCGNEYVMNELSFLVILIVWYFLACATLALADDEEERLCKWIFSSPHTFVGFVGTFLAIMLFPVTIYFFYKNNWGENYVAQRHLCRLRIVRKHNMDGWQNNCWSKRASQIFRLEAPTSHLPNLSWNRKENKAWRSYSKQSSVWF